MKKGEVQAFEHVCSVDRAEWEFGTGASVVQFLLRERFGREIPPIVVLESEDGDFMEVWLS